MTDNETTPSIDVAAALPESPDLPTQPQVSPNLDEPTITTTPTITPMDTTEPTAEVTNSPKFTPIQSPTQIESPQVKVESTSITAIEPITESTSIEPSSIEPSSTEPTSSEPKIEMQMAESREEASMDIVEDTKPADDNNRIEPDPYQNDDVESDKLAIESDEAQTKEEPSMDAVFADGAKDEPSTVDSAAIASATIDDIINTDTKINVKKEINVDDTASTSTNNNNDTADTNTKPTSSATDEAQPTTPTSPSSSRLQRIKRLKAKLINEEHRLVLMKKIRQSQTRPVVAQQQQNISQAGSSNANNYLSNSHGNRNNSMSSPGGSGTSQNQMTHLKKLRSPHTGSMSLQKSLNQSSSASPMNTSLRGGLGGLAGSPGVSLPANLSTANSSLASTIQNSAAAAMAAAAAAANQTPAHAHQRPKVNSLWNPPPQQARHPTPAGIAPPHVGNLSRQPITTPPNVVQAMMSSLTGQQSLLMNQTIAAAAAAASSSSSSSSRARQSQQGSNSFNKNSAHMSLNNNNSMPGSLNNKRSSTGSFKPSIQRQLEQTLLQQQQQQQQSSGRASLTAGFTPNLSNKRSVGNLMSPHVGNLSRQPITTPPNVVQDLRGSLAPNSAQQQQSLLMNAGNMSGVGGASSRRPQPSPQLQQQTPPFSSLNKSQAAQILLQKRTAAKAAIQKQLEQTLMQLPQKQLQLGIDFLPNANNIEFVYYVGLEACVDYLTDTKNPMDTQTLEKPYECSTCGTDFTPSWSWKRANAVCENCVTNHVKKSIKNSQGNRIKSILHKAAKQEQDMDQRIMAEAASVVSSSGSAQVSSPSQHSLLQPVSHQSQSQQPRSSGSNFANNNISGSSNINNTNNSNSNNNNMNSQAWSRVNASPLANVANNTNTSRTQQSTNVQAPVVNSNPLGNLQPAALASLLQMNPQLSTLASLMTGNNSNTASLTSASGNSNNFAQVAALLMNQIAMNLYKR